MSQGSRNIFLLLKPIRSLFVLLSMMPALCRAAYDPPVTHITALDMQTLVQCYLDASGRGGEPKSAISDCDKQAALVRPRTHSVVPAVRAGQAAEGSWNPLHLIAAEVTSHPLLGGALVLLALLLPLLFLRLPGRRRKGDPSCCVPGESLWL